jgi:hypothetical protein
LELLTISTDERLNGKYSASEEDSQLDDLHGEAVPAVIQENEGV